MLVVNFSFLEQMNIRFEDIGTEACMLKCSDLLERGEHTLQRMARDERCMVHADMLRWFAFELARSLRRDCRSGEFCYSWSLMFGLELFVFFTPKKSFEKVGLFFGSIV